jgi:hypothetical protein
MFHPCFQQKQRRYSHVVTALLLAVTSIHKAHCMSPWRHQPRLVPRFQSVQEVLVLCSRCHAVHSSSNLITNTHSWLRRKITDVRDVMWTAPHSAVLAINYPVTAIAPPYLTVCRFVPRTALTNCPSNSYKLCFLGGTDSILTHNLHESLS